MLKSSPPTGTLIRTKQLACASDIISDGSGLRLVVVNSSIAGIRASQLEAVKSVLGFEAAKDASYWTEGIYVVSDKAFKYVAAFLRTRPSLVVFEGCESLVVPNCPEIKADTVWMTTTDLAVHGHKGFVKNFIRTAYSKDLVLDLEGESLGVDYTRVLEYTYWDSNENSTNIIAKALDKGKTDLAIKAYPGVFCNAAHDSTGDCPICYEAPSTLVKTSCCNRDFCYGCFAKCITHSSNCPWCRQDACLSSTKMMTSYGRAPFKDVLLMNLILSELADDRESSFLVVTFDDLYTFRFYNNPLQTQAVWLTGGAGMVKDAVDRLRSRSRPVAVAKADSAVWAGLKLDVKHVVFTESESSSKTLMKRWMSCVPETAKVHRLVSVLHQISNCK